MSQDLVIRQKAEDMIAYAYEALRASAQRETYLAADIKRSMFRLRALIITTNKRYYKKSTLQDLDIELDVLRSYVRLAMTLGFLPFRKYEIWAGQLNEIGRMVGGWMRSVKQ